MNIALRIIAGLLAVVFLVSGAGKVIQLKEKLAASGLESSKTSAAALSTP
jgi:hypothetical protein